MVSRAADTCGWAQRTLDSTSVGIFAGQVTGLFAYDLFKPVSIVAPRGALISVLGLVWTTSLMTASITRIYKDRLYLQNAQTTPSEHPKTTSLKNRCTITPLNLLMNTVQLLGICNLLALSCSLDPWKTFWVLSTVAASLNAPALANAPVKA